MSILSVASLYAQGFEVKLCMGLGGVIPDPCHVANARVGRAHGFGFGLVFVVEVSDFFANDKFTES